ncbi:HDOD domain-containing protein [Pokkaliibacter sp. CJK22405]|uniref:HDOD domain-containing protein n=1 Tax=Pokkaliibacter sp. CJK22405 TaxID=3384615 RepID=UPI0039848E12
MSVIEANKKRVLLVDDDPLILSSLRRALRKKRDGWEIAFVQSGPVALALLEREAPYDVIVTDMRMPGMDGVRLLEHIVTRYPAMGRIVLTGYAEVEDLVRATELSHQCLAKPCDIDVLIDAINQSCALQQMISSPRVREVAGSIGSLPMMPAVIRRIQQLVQSPDASMGQVAREIESDIGLASRLLKMVNSGFAGANRTIETVQDALVRLGMEHVSDLLLVNHALNELSPNNWQRFSFDAVRLRSVAVGQFARVMALQSGLSPRCADQVVMGGLLHDLGMLLFAARMPEQYGQVFDLMAAESIDLPEAERRIIGVTHAELGAYLLSLWHLPAPIIQMVLAHHDPSLHEASAKPCWLVYLADALLPSLSEEAGLRARFDADKVTAQGFGELMKQWQEDSAHWGITWR